jgi:hypothetical protein
MQKGVSMGAYFTVETVAATVGPKATGANAKFRGKTLKDNVKLTLTEDEGMPLSILSDNGFEYVVERLNTRGESFSWSTSKVAKFLNAMLADNETELAQVAASKPGPTIEELMAEAEERNAKLDAISDRRYKAISKELAKFGLKIAVA